MKKNILLALSSIALGVLFTFFILNKESIYAKEEYTVYAFQYNAYKNKEDAINNSQNIPSIIIEEDNLYKVYIALYKDIDLINRMLDYFKNKNIEVYLKLIKVDKNFYEILSKYEEIVKKVSDVNVYDNINKSILNNYLESLEQK